MDARPIGVLDSGVGGLSILREIRNQLPAEDVLFFADQAHVPYGARSLEEVRSFTAAITRFLLDQGAKVIVVACNTASAAALRHLRATFPETSFVGMEPAVKPAAQISRSRAVGVLATPATFQGELFASVVERFAAGVRILPQTLPGLVERIEAGDLTSARTREIVARVVEPMLAQGVDTLVLACTHYPFVVPLVAEIAGPGVQVIDPSPAIARQTRRVLEAGGRLCPPEREGSVALVTTGSPARIGQLAGQLIHLHAPALAARWESGALRLDP